MRHVIRSLMIVTLTTALIAGGILLYQGKPQNVLAVGDLSVDFHVPTNDPIFVINNMAPGDPSISKNIDVTNNGTVTRMVSVRGVRIGGIGSAPQLETVLSLTITENGTPLYGTGSSTGPKTVADFFTDSNQSDGIKLNTVDPGKHKTYIFTVSFPSTAGNEFQAKSVIFNLVFGQVSGDHVLINEVYYLVDSAHGMDSPKDRGILGAQGNNVKLSIKGNGAGSVNTIIVNQSQACQILQNNTTTTNTSVNIQSNTGNNKANGNTGGSVTIKSGSSTSVVNVSTQGGVNIANLNCGTMLGQDDEWVELFNPTDHNINLKNWYFMENSGIATPITATRIIKAGGFALVSKDESTWKYWSENPAALKISLGKEFGDGLDNAGDHLILFDSTGLEQDRMSWGTDKTGFTPSASLPTVPLGSSLERIVPGLDTDTTADWKISTPPTP